MPNSALLDDVVMPVKTIAAIAGGSMVKSGKTTAYAVGQLITFGAAGASAPIIIPAARGVDLSGMVRRVRLTVNDVSWLNAVVRCHFFKDVPVFTNGDAANFAGGLSDAVYIGAVDVTLSKQFSDPVVKGIGVPNEGTEIVFLPSAGTQNLAMVFEAQSITAGGHTAGSTFTAAVEVLQN